MTCCGALQKHLLGNLNKLSQEPSQGPCGLKILCLQGLFPRLALSGVYIHGNSTGPPAPFSHHPTQEKLGLMDRGSYIT